MSKEKSLSYTISNTYSTLNERTDKTKTVWLVFHGIRYLSKYFLKYFNIWMLKKIILSHLRHSLNII